jgi:hypothetical protein
VRETAAAYPNKAWLQALVVHPPKNHAWHLHYWEAWHALRHDRQFIGQMAIEQPISFMAIDAYARRFAIEGEAFSNLLRFVSVIDTEFLTAREIDRSKALEPVKPPEDMDSGRPGQNPHHSPSA